MIIGLTGKARSGKNTVAKLIAEQVEHTYELAFADRLKEAARVIFDFTDAQLYGKEKDLPDGRFNRPDGTALTPRWALQRLGTEFGRECDPDLWVKIAMAEAEKVLFHGYTVILTDVRFPNEAQAVRDAGGEVWRIIRPDFYTAEFHASEMQPPELIALCNKTIRNFGTLEELSALVKEALSG